MKNKLLWAEQLVNNSHIGVLVVDENRNNLFVNDRLCEFTGYTRDEILHSGARIFHKDEASFKKFAEIAFNTVLEGKILSMEYEFKHKNGSLFWAHISGDPVKNKKEVLWTLVDITAQKDAQDEANNRLNLLDSVISATPDFIFYLDYLNSDGRYIGCNESFQKFIGKSSNEVIGFTDIELFGKDVGEEFRKKDQEVLRTQSTSENEESFLQEDGSKVFFNLTRTPFYNAQKEMIGIVRIAHDITQRKKADEKLKEEREYLQSIIDGVHDPIMVIREDYNIEIMNKTLRDSLEFMTLEDKNKPKCYEVSHQRSTPCDGISHPCPLQSVLESAKHTKVVHTHKNIEGENRFVELSAEPLVSKDGKCIGIVESARDITEHLQTQDDLRAQKDILKHQAHHDALTGLPNRALFEDRLAHSIEKSKRANSKTALLFIDLDHFKEINDSLGHLAGDEVLKAVAFRLKKTIREEDTLARLGGDEFTIILGDIQEIEDASIVAQNILESLSLAIEVNENKLYVSSSIGISVFPDDGTTTQNLLKFADSAMYKAKEEGRSNFQYYNQKLTELAFERVFMEAGLRQAIEHQEFVVFYQPQVDGETNKLIGMEALVRWQHPNMGLLSPAKFINLAERTGLIIEIDKIVMKAAMTQIAQWYKKGLNPGVLAINLAMKQLTKKDFFEILKSLITEANCQPEWLELEVTEGQIMSHPEAAIDLLQKISDFGIELAIDDFGTGYSSLAYLKRLPIDKLKIDQTFIRDLPDDEEDAGITKAVIALATSLNLKIIAEGVETQAQKDFVVENGCKNIQGYFYSKPICADDMQLLLEKGGVLNV